MLSYEKGDHSIMESCDVRIKKLIKEKKTTKSEFAEKIDVSYSIVCQYMNGTRHPSRKVLQRMSEYFDADVDYIEGRQDIRRRMNIETVFEKNKKFTPEEIEIISLYRLSEPNIQEAIRVLLKIKKG